MANISRNSFDETKNYDKVILQQGRPITDYDWNEAFDIERVKLRNVIRELFGDGAIGDGFKVYIQNNQVYVTQGVLYLKGYRARLFTDTQVTNVPTTNGTYKVYVNLFEQEIDSLMDPDIKHPKLPIEPTRRIKIVSNIEIGTSVPADTATNKYYHLADLTISGGNPTTVVDKRAVKATFEGEGFTIKGSVTLGDAEDDVIDIRGRIKNNSSTFSGRVYVDDTLQVVGDIISSGKIVQTGKYYEVARVPLFGLAGDIQFQSDSTTWEDVTPKLYWLFDFTNGRTVLPPVPSGATRKYKLRIAYSQDNASYQATIRLITEDLATTAISWNLYKFTGGILGDRMYAESPEFTQGDTTKHWKIQAMITGGNISIHYVELVAYDVY